MQKLVSLLLLVCTIGCGSDATDPHASIAGTWTLQTVNGVKVPYVIQQTGQNKVELVSDEFRITTTGTFTQISTFRTTQNGQITTQTVPDAGTYTLNGTAVTFRFNSDNSTGTGSWNGNTLTEADNGVALVYTR